MRGSSAAPPIKPRRYTSARAASAPANAASGSAQGPERCSAIARTAPSPAPPDSPSKNGSASGLRTSACKPAPAMPSDPPTKKASSARGARRFQTMSDRNSSLSGIAAGPMATLASSASTATVARTAHFIAATSVTLTQPVPIAVPVDRTASPGARGSGDHAPRARLAIPDAWRRRA